MELSHKCTLNNNLFFYRKKIVKTITFINKFSFLYYLDNGGRVIMQLEEPSSKFIKIRCPKCKNEQIMFGKASSIVKCLVCSKELAGTTGGKARVKARILEVLE